jgi:hypothetical protein
LHEPFPIALGALPGILDGDVKCRLPTIAWGQAKLGHLTAGGILGGDAGQLLGGIPEDIGRCLEGWYQWHVAHAASGRLCPWPVGVMAVSPPTTGLVVVLVLRVMLRLRAHLVGAPTSLVIDAPVSQPQRGLGREISRWLWSYPHHRGLHGGSLPTGSGVSHIRGRIRSTLAGALHQLCSDDGMDLHQLAVHPIHLIGGGWR